MVEDPSRMGVMAYQDHTFAINDRPDRRLTDRELLDDWSAAFPNQAAEVFVGTLETRLSHVRSIRLLYNKGQQGHGKRDNSGQVVGPAETLSLPYNAEGERTWYSTRWLNAALMGRSPSQAGLDGSLLSERPLVPARRSVDTREAVWSHDLLETAAAHYFEFLGRLMRRDPSSSNEAKEIPSKLLAAFSGDAVIAKFHEISAALHESGARHLPQYPPDVVPCPELVAALNEYLGHHAARVFGEDIEQSRPTVRGAADLCFVEAPTQGLPGRRHATRLRVNLAEFDAQKRKVGKDGEEFVVDLERQRLTEGGRPDLAKRVEWLSESQGDGAGYDISSFDLDGEAIYIEVKTTTNGIGAPFLLTHNEVRVADSYDERYRLYRVFDFHDSPRVYKLRGPLSTCCELEPEVYRAMPRAG
jgi:hypothetical protein